MYCWHLRRTLDQSLHTQAELKQCNSSDNNTQGDKAYGHRTEIRLQDEHGTDTNYQS